MIEYEGGYYDCIPLGSCPNNTEYLVRNVPTSDICQCVENAVKTDSIIDNNGTYEVCKCKDGYVTSKDGTSCIVKPPNEPNQGGESTASPMFVAFITLILVAVLASCAMMLAFMRK